MLVDCGWIYVCYLGICWYIRGFDLFCEFGYFVMLCGLDSVVEKAKNGVKSRFLLARALIIFGYDLICIKAKNVVK